MRPLIPILLTITLAGADQASFTVTVAAGAHARRDCIVTFTLPATTTPWPNCLRDPAGRVLPLQVDDPGVDAQAGRTACFVLPELAAGKTLVLTAIATEPTPLNAQAEKVAGTVAFTVQGRPVVTYQQAPSPLPAGYDPAVQRGGYLFPLFTPSGRLVIDDYPPNHRHHHGIWTAWTSATFAGRALDFWNLAKKSATIEPVALDRSWSGPVHAGLVARHAYIDLLAKPAPIRVLDEAWTMRVYSLGTGDAKVRILDLAITQSCATDQPLELPTYHYGGLGVRGNRAWDAPGLPDVLNSDGQARIAADSHPSRWCRLGGPVDGGQASVAILCHPGNFRAPQPVRMHPKEPYLCWAPSQGGPWRISPGEPYVMHYRILTADGLTDRAELDRCWTDYAEPPIVTIQPPGP
jgi:Methane oxygenase PmoA